MRKVYLFAILLLIAPLTGCSFFQDDEPSPHPQSNEEDANEQNDQATNEAQNNTMSAKEMLTKTVAAAKKGKIAGSNFVAGQTKISEVIQSWGKPGHVNEIERGIYAAYPKKNMTFGYREDEPIFDVRFDDALVHKLTFSLIKQNLGEPDTIHYFKDAQHNQKILVYNVNKTYQLKFIVPKPTKSHSNPHVDHISVFKPDPIRKRVRSMTLDEKIGQMVIAGIDGTSLSGHTKKLINHQKIGGFILYQQNIQTTEQTRTLLNDMKTENADNRLPLFLSVDQEGGSVDRMPDEFVDFPTNRAIGNVGNPQFSYKVGQLLGKELQAFGFNMDFAPVLDINSNPDNPVIGDRSFSAKPGIVSRLGIQTMKGIQTHNVIPVVKHFPGHGDTSVDSHVGLPKLSDGLEHLRNFELVPFSKAIQKGADAVMIAHILFPKLDTDYPASMSKKIITGILRNELNFEGVVITDDMTMGAISKNYGVGKASVKSVNAGSNIILVAHQYNKVTKVIQALKTATQNGDIPKEKINNSVYKIIQLKRKYDLSNQKAGPIDVQAVNDSIRSVLNQYMD
ncbi:beta-N-acetylhexosaminidase [Halobacillus hunanensis]|uniref:beta-N-acetylhexosaminidase n=1 Tax=Halobacillus hunanensis TaxID=578214 RepID=UPI001116D17F|nr:beta-N-acetylhexosaminidase [Halobacillus hunanensis]